MVQRVLHDRGLLVMTDRTHRRSHQRLGRSVRQIGAAVQIADCVASLWVVSLLDLPSPWSLDRTSLLQVHPGS